MCNLEFNMLIQYMSNEDMLQSHIHYKIYLDLYSLHDMLYITDISCLLD